MPLCENYGEVSLCVLLKLRKIPFKSHIKISEQVPIAGFKEVMCSR